ncbi:MAG TPA: peptide ABC transporter substrate-binding protein [Ktedonobacteraceae bacterium]
MSINQKNYHHRLLLFTFCLLPLLICSCNLFGGENPLPTRQAVKAPNSMQTYTVPITGVEDFDTLDPALAHDPSSINAIQMIYTGLVQINDNFQIQPQLAESWELGSNGTTWTFHLKPNLKFSDGTSLTSADVAYSINRALEPATKSTVAPVYLGLIKDSDRLLAGQIPTLIGDSLQTPDPHTLVIITNKKAAYFLAMLTSPCSYIVEQSLINKYGAQFTDHLNEGGGAGPFKVAQYTHRADIDFIPNPNYYNQRPQLQKVTFTLYHSADQAYQDYQNNKLDTTPVPLSMFASNQKNQEFHQVPLLWINYYSMNYLTPPFDNIHIRQAFALAIDKQAIVNNAWKGTVEATNHIVPPELQGSNLNFTGPDDTKSLSGDPKKAQDLLNQGLHEEGWHSISEIPAITLTYVSGVSTFDQEVSELVARWQQVLKVKVAVNAVDEDTLLADMTAATNNASGLQMWGLAWVGQYPEYPDPHDWLSQQFGQGSPFNNENYGQNTSQDAAQQQLIQQQMDAADANIDAGKNIQPIQIERTQSYQQEEQQIVNDVGWLPMEQATATFLRTTSIVGIKDNAEGIIPPDDWANIYRVQ